MGKCQWKPPEGAWNAENFEGCPYDPRGDSDYCIFHIPLEQKREKPELADEFKKAFDDFFIDSSLKSANGEFVGFVLPDGINLSRIDFRRPHERKQSANLGHKPVNFSWAIFGDKANFRQATFGDKADFRGAIFRDQADFSKAEFGDDANFWEATFGEDANFERASFGDKANFWWATFGVSPHFRQANFGYYAYFGEANFGSNVDFGSSNFGDKAFFSEAVFSDKADFASAKFGDEARFEKALFGGEAMFVWAVFGDKADFAGAKFFDKADFWNATFGNEIDFSGAQFLSLAKFLNVKASETAFLFSNARLESGGDLHGLMKKPSSSQHLLFRQTKFKGPAIFHEADLSRVRFELVDLQNLSFFKSKISQTEFVSCQWGSGPENHKHWHRSSGFNLGFRRPRLLLDELVWRKQNQKPARKIPRLFKPSAWLWSLHIAASSRVPEIEAIDKMEPIKDLQAEDIEILGLQFKQSLEATKDPITAGDFHFAVMEMKLEKARAAGRFWRSVGLTLYKFINGYGERYARTLMWLALLVAVSTLLFAWQGETLFSGYATFSERLEPAFFWACQHILPFKFGTELWHINTTDSAMRWLTMGETFLGSTLFAFMILAMRRRFKR